MVLSPWGIQLTWHKIETALYYGHVDLIGAQVGWGKTGDIWITNGKKGGLSIRDKGHSRSVHDDWINTIQNVISSAGNNASSPADAVKNWSITLHVASFRMAQDTQITEYEIQCVASWTSKKTGRPCVSRWSAWQRYRAFEALHETLKAELGWRMEEVSFTAPDTKSKFLLKMMDHGQDFLHQRMRELERYVQQVRDRTRAARVCVFAAVTP